MWLLDFLQNLPLIPMFLAALVIGLTLCWIILGFVRFAINRSRLDPSVPLPILDVLIGTISAIFALMIAFSAAGIWNDTVQANTAVRREANALKNVLALANSLPSDVGEKIRESVSRYGRYVVERDWPAMDRKVSSNDPVYDASDAVLVNLVNMLSLDHARISSLSTVAPLLGQIIEARDARLARITLANAGVSAAQWSAMLLIALAALTAVALCHNHDFAMQALAMQLYTLAAVAAFFVILAHDRPFIGTISVSPAPLLQLATGR